MKHIFVNFVALKNLNSNYVAKANTKLAFTNENKNNQKCNCFINWSPLHLTHVSHKLRWHLKMSN